MKNNKGINVLSLFDGMSCGQIALKELGITVDKYYASEIDKFAIEQTTLNFPNTIQLGDVTEWRSWNVDWSSIDLVIGGSPCFVAGTKIVTSEGYKNIEDVRVGDRVLTHKNQWQTVRNIGGKYSETYKIKAQGILDTITTANHPFYVRTATRKWDNKKRTSKRVFSRPKWVEAFKLKKGDFIGIPILTTNVNHYDITEEEAYIIGRYIADGHTSKSYRIGDGRPNHRHWQLILSIGKDKVMKFKSTIKDNHYSCYEHSKSVYRCVFYNKKLVQIVESNCGSGAVNKYISKKLLDLPVCLLKRVLQGFFEGDGSYRNGVYRATTVSRELAMSLCLAISKVYRVNVNIEYTRRPKKHIIEGRTVNQNDTYTVSFRKEMKKQSNAEVIDGIVWCPFKAITQTNKVERVFNLEVDIDNSYVANNAIVHNCQGFSFAGRQLAFDDPRSKLFFEFVDILSHIKRTFNPNVRFLLENVKMKKEFIAIINEYLGVAPVEINSSLVSAQNRVRLYWTNIKTRKEGLFGHLVSDIPQPKDRGIYIRDILDSNVADNYYLSEKALEGVVYYKDKNQQKGYRYRADVRQLNEKIQTVTVGDKGAYDIVHDNRCNKPKVVAKTSSKYESSSRVYSISGKSQTINTCGGGDREPKVAVPSRGLNIVAQLRTPFRQEASIYSVDGVSPTLLASNPQDKSKIMDNGRVRRLTPSECARLQTIPDWYKWECSKTQQYKMLGNGWTIDVIKHIFSFL